MQLVLNCENVLQIVKLRPHFNTIKKLLNIKENDIDLNETVAIFLNLFYTLIFVFTDI